MMMYHLRWSYGGRFDASSLDVARYMEVVGALMTSVELHDDLVCLWTPSNTSWTWDDAMMS